jgi:hypothetical protein
MEFLVDAVANAAWFFSKHLYSFGSYHNVRAAEFLLSGA